MSVPFTPFPVSLFFVSSSLVRHSVPHPEFQTEDLVVVVGVGPGTILMFGSLGKGPEYLVFESLPGPFDMISSGGTTEPSCDNKLLTIQCTQNRRTNTGR